MSSWEVLFFAIWFVCFGTALGLWWGKRQERLLRLWEEEQEEEARSFADYCVREREEKEWAAALLRRMEEGRAKRLASS